MLSYGRKGSFSFKASDWLARAGQCAPPPFPRAVFVELMQTATSSVEFSFNNIMHRQIDGVAMGSPLSPSLANIFVGYYEALLFKSQQTSNVLSIRR